MVSCVYVYALQCDAGRCRVLQRVAVDCNELQFWEFAGLILAVMRCGQSCICVHICGAVCCNALQEFAVCCTACSGEVFEDWY